MVEFAFHQALLTWFSCIVYHNNAHIMKILTRRLFGRFYITFLTLWPLNWTFK